MDTLTIVALGLLLGIRHAVDPDHVVAISTIATRASFRSSAMIGSLWGIGHTLTLLAVGGSLVVMRSQLSARTALAMEFGVAVMLIALGVITLINASRTDPFPPPAARPVVVGMVHGMAGSAAVALVVWRSQATNIGKAPVVISAQNPPTPSAPVESSATAAPPVTVTVNRTTPQRPVRAQQVRARRVATSEPDVIVPADQRLALVALLASMKRGTQVPGEVVQVLDSEGRMPVASAITVSPITIELLGPPPGGGSRERQ